MSIRRTLTVLALAVALLFPVAAIADGGTAVDLSNSEWDAFLRYVSELESGTAVALARSYCQGTFTDGQGTETIRMVACDPFGSDCVCSDAGVTCGSNSKSAPAGTTYVPGSCKSTILASASETTNGTATTN